MLEVSQYLTSNYTIVIIIKASWYWHKTNLKITEQNRIEDQDTNPYSYSHFDFDKGAPKHM
jgi:hypothetical protein